MKWIRERCKTTNHIFRQCAIPVGVLHYSRLAIIEIMAWIKPWTKPNLNFQVVLNEKYLFYRCSLCEILVYGSLESLASKVVPQRVLNTPSCAQCT